MNFNLKGILIIIGFIFTFFLPESTSDKKNSFEVEGDLFNNSIVTKVNHKLAKLMLTDSSHAEVRKLHHAFGNKKLNTQTLVEITNEYSVDVATLYFFQKLYQEEKNKTAQNLYQNYLSKSEKLFSEKELSNLREFIIVFVPGLGYKEDTTTGADFSRQRKLLNLYGIRNELIQTNEWGLSEENAVMIASRLRELSVSNNKIIVVSASKGGLETAIALGQIMSKEEVMKIAAWVSVGGVLRGSPIADNYLIAPSCWFAEFMLWTKGEKINIVQDLSYKKRTKTFDELTFPKELKIIHFIGAPLFSQVSKEIKGRYSSLLDFGPNDGLTPLADEIIEGGIVVSELGLDHYFRDTDIDKKTLALALVAVNQN